MTKKDLLDHINDMPDDSEIIIELGTETRQIEDVVFSTKNSVITLVAVDD